MNTKFSVYAADIGSIANNKFAWCRDDNSGLPDGNGEIREMVKSVSRDLSQGVSVALGFEAPLFVPVAEEPKELNRARKGEGSRPWSAGAGCGSLATALPICVWTFEQLAKGNATTNIFPTFHWEAFRTGTANLFIWEAFVSGEAKKLAAESSNPHLEDAKIAARTFWNALNENGDIMIDKIVTAPQPFSLVGAALLRSGLTKDLGFLSQSCLVLKS